MKFEGQPLKSKSDHPSWFVDFLSNYNLVVRSLLDMTTRKFNGDTDVAVFNRQYTVIDNTEFTIQHDIPYNTRCLSYTGRVECLVIRSSSPGRITAKAKLLRFRFVSSNTNQPYSSELRLEDTTLLQPGDILRFPEGNRAIVFLNDNTVYLDSEVFCDNLTTISLYQDAIVVTVI